ncbi:thiol-disulfide oxidoreductase DCC family protein [Bernardetia sp.]|uniref:thiol-disulfide oxidoreductase DCC family protein n=1 Tax=Bernardetia sp. TaxID=1937974 RepID=UPI0025BCB07B|nr:thiol-disulfide oxidoreductase DCC family protein [Bernardetia sp.]
METLVQKQEKLNFQEVAQNKTIILFDGVCNLCNGAINFVIDKDKNNNFHFASLQSEFGQALLAHFGRDTADFDSMIVYENGKIRTKSTAALRIAAGLSGGWKFFSVFKIIPTVIRNAVYNLIARNRYKWFGQKNECRIPTPELKAKFVEKL